MKPLLINSSVSIDHLERGGDCLEISHEYPFLIFMNFLNSIGGLVCVSLPLETGQEESDQGASLFDCRPVAASSPQSWIQQVPHRVTEHVESINDYCQEQPRPDGQPGGYLHVLASFPAEQSSPTGSPPQAVRTRGSSERPRR